MSGTTPGWIYVLDHPAWSKLGMVKCGKTSRDPRKRAAEITSVSGLLAPATIAACEPVSDITAAEQAVHRMLADKRVRKRRELFRVDVETARQVIEVVARSQPRPSFLAFNLLRSGPSPAPRPVMRNGSWRYGRRRVSAPVRVVAGIIAGGALAVLLEPPRQPGGRCSLSAGCWRR